MPTTEKHKWTFAPRFRARAFGWKSQPAIKRVREAVAEIKKVARKDPVLGGAGAVLFLEKVSPAIEQVDGSSGAIGSAVSRAVEELVEIIARAPADDRSRDAWLERLFQALQDDDIPYIETLAGYWGELCVTPARASSWVDRLLPVVQAVWAEPFAYFKGTSACLSCLLVAGRHPELMELLETARHVWWSDRKYGVRALAAMGRVDDAIAYAQRSVGRDESDLDMARTCEALLLAAGRADEAYERYALTANVGTSRLATFRAIAKKYPHLDRTRLLQDLVESTPGEEGKWFATARELGLLDQAVALASQSPCDPLTLNRAARDHLASHPKFALEVALLSLRWIAAGHGYDITGVDVLQAYDRALQAAAALDIEEGIRGRIEAFVADDRSPGMFIRRVLEARLERDRLRLARS